MSEPDDAHRRRARDRLLFHEGLDLPCFASFPLLGDARGRAALRRYFEPFLEIAEERGLPFVLDTATWRANPDWGAQLGFDADALADANRDAVAFARELAGRAHRRDDQRHAGPARRRVRRRRAHERRRGG